MVISREELQAAAIRSDELQRQSREILITSVRKAAHDGYSQRDIAKAINRSQPEVSRLLRFMPKSEHGRILAGHRQEILVLAKRHGLSDVRVFGSTAKGTDTPNSDIDVLVDRSPTAGLFELGRFEHAVSMLLGRPVDVVPASSLKPRIAQSILEEAVPL